MENKIKTQQEIEQEILEMNDKFSAFLHTKGIVAKFKLAFSDIGESAKKQHAADVSEFEAVKAKSAEDNKEFVEFLNTKGIKAKYKLVIENIKKGAKEAPAKTAAQIAKVRVETQSAVANANAVGKNQPMITEISAETLKEEFNAFLKAEGLDGKYTVFVTED